MADNPEQDFTLDLDTPGVEAPEVPELVSDGKRMRMVWRKKDRDGDPSAHLVERSMNLIRGHPTWKIFIDDIPLPITRGGKDEPPHYVYLDDRACYAIYCSKAYSNEELRKFWPWDFNHQGNIKQGRINRGHAAYLDDSYTQLAKGRLRARDQWYTFYGAPDVSKYEPLRPKTDTHMEKLVAQEYAEEAERSLADENISESEKTNVTEPATPGKETKAAKAPPSRLSTPRTSSAKAPKKTPSRAASSSPVKNKGQAKAVDDTRSSAGSLGVFNPKRASTQAKPQSEDSPTKSSPLKRRYVSPTEYGSPTKRTNSSTPRRPTSGFGGDGANDEDGKGIIVLDDSDDELLREAKRRTFQLPNKKLDVNAFKASKDEFVVETKHHSLKTSLNNDEVEQLKWEVKALKANCDQVVRERDHLREIVVQPLASKIAQSRDLTNRVMALQNCTNSLGVLKEDMVEIMDSAKKEIQPTVALCNDMETVLGQQGKHLYENGMDEEWKTLLDDARKFNDANGQSTS